MKQTVLLIIALMLCFDVRADSLLVLTNSKHYGDINYDCFNEQNTGFGYKTGSYMFGGYRNTVCKNSYYIAKSLKLKENTNFEFSAILGVVSGYNEVLPDGYVPLVFFDIKYKKEISPHLLIHPKMADNDHWTIAFGIEIQLGD